MKNIEIIYNQVANSINDRDDAFTFIKDEIRAALNGSYEANYFARKSQIKINDSPPEEIPYSSDTPQAILTNLLNELTSTRDAVLIRLKIIDRVMKKFRFGKYQDSVSKNKKKRGQVLYFAWVCFGFNLILQNSRPDPVVGFAKFKT